MNIFKKAFNFFSGKNNIKSPTPKTVVTERRTEDDVHEYHNPWLSIRK